jgi:plasmid stabilization system protein ParE
MSRCEFTPSARDDLQDIHDYIADDSPSNALRLLDRIESQCHRLAEQTFMGVARPEFNRPNLRSFVVRNTPYIIFDYPAVDGVQIAYIRHGSRNLADLFE